MIRVTTLHSVDNALNATYIYIYKVTNYTGISVGFNSLSIRGNHSVGRQISDNGHLIVHIKAYFFQNGEGEIVNQQTSNYRGKCSTAGRIRVLFIK